MARLSPAQKAKRRNQAQERRAPLFAWAGMLTPWTAERVAYQDLARAIASYENTLARERCNRAELAAYIAMLDEAISPENREEVVADMLSRAYIACDLVRQCDYLCRYLATYQRRTPGAVFAEAQSRAL